VIVISLATHDKTQKPDRILADTPIWVPAHGDSLLHLVRSISSEERETECRLVERAGASTRTDEPVTNPKIKLVSFSHTSVPRSDILSLEEERHHRQESTGMAKGRLSDDCADRRTDTPRCSRKLVLRGRRGPEPAYGSHGRRSSRLCGDLPGGGYSSNLCQAGIRRSPSTDAAR
jgi:hypothetical protein